MNSIEKNEIYKQTLLILLKKVLSFFEANGFNYWAADGTCLGAVRHHNIIPWDDDVDLLMISSDYFRLMDYEAQLKKIGLSIVSAYNAPMAMTYLKIVDTNSTVWEQPTYPLTGIWIDIFPMFYVDDLNEIEATNKKYRYLYNYLYKSSQNYPIKNLIAPLFKLDFIGLYKRFANTFYYKKKREQYKDAFLNFQRTLDKNRGRYLVSYFGIATDIFESSWFHGFSLVSFDTMQIRIPVDYHEYLKYRYNDYMQLPPENQRLPHSKLYVNTRKALSMKEVRERLKEGVDFEY